MQYMFFIDPKHIEKFNRKKRMYLPLYVMNIFLWFAPILLAIKIVATLGAMFLGYLLYLDFKYIRGSLNTPLVITNGKEIRYYNEFRGEIKLPIKKIINIRIYYKDKGFNLLELRLRNGIKEDINISGFSKEDCEKIIDILEKRIGEERIVA